MLRPSAYLTFILTGDAVAAGNASAIKRAYSYVAPTRILATRPDGEGSGGVAVNTIALSVTLAGNDPWADDAAWNDVLLPWLAAKLDKLFGTVRECNNEARKSFSGRIDYGALELDVCGVSAHFELDADSMLASDVLEGLNELRRQRAV